MPHQRFQRFDLYNDQMLVSGKLALNFENVYNASKENKYKCRYKKTKGFRVSLLYNGHITVT